MPHRKLTCYALSVIFNLILLSGIVVLSAAAVAAVASEKIITIRSRSDQFVANCPATIPPIAAQNMPTNQEKYISLNAPVVVVIAERIKQCILESLAANDEWKGKVILNIHPVDQPDEEIWVNAQKTEIGWIYNVDLPAYLQKTRLIRTLVQVVLKEIADRYSGVKPAELPPWLGPAMTMHILINAPDILIMDQFTKKVKTQRKVNPITIVRKNLNGQPPLSWDELCWHGGLYNSEPLLNRYTLSSYLLFHHLMSLKNGNVFMCQMLRQLPSHWNWQIAFLKAYEAHFKSLREVDKWWSVIIESFMGKDGTRAYTFEESLRKLDETLTCPIKFQIETNIAGEVKFLTLQDIITQWSFNQQKVFLRQKIAQLQALKPHISPHLAKLLDDYCSALTTYIQRRAKAGFSNDLPPFVNDSVRLILRDTINDLNNLDLIRQDFRHNGVNLQDPDSHPEITEFVNQF